MKHVRFGIIGAGGMGCQHGRSIVEAKDKLFSLAAVADADLARARAIGEELGVPAFDSGVSLLDSDLVDAVIIAMPHYFHPPLAIEAAQRKIHVLCEKPMAANVGPARAMVAECRKNKVAFGVMFQHRNRPEMQAMKQMIAKGVIGEPFRVQMICSSWLRTQAYYDGGAWRGTWDGEGGGILINQAPHSLDLFQWIGGMPKRVLAMLHTRHHKIEVENTANCIFDYGDGRTGYIYATTAEAPGYEQLLVAGDKGTLIAEDGKLRWAKLSGSLKKFLMTSKERMKAPPVEWADVPLPEGWPKHIGVTRNFVEHILKGKPLTCPGSEGVNELEISNAVYISGYKNKPVDLPVDAAEMEKLLKDLAKTRGNGTAPSNRTLANKHLARLLGKLSW